MTIDFATMAREFIQEDHAGLSFVEALTAKFTQSFTLGWDEALGEAARIAECGAKILPAEPDDWCSKTEVRCQIAVDVACDVKRQIAFAIRLRIRALPSKATDVSHERAAIAEKAREFAGHYPQSSDGRNTFILLAEWIEARGAAPAHPTEPGEVERPRKLTQDDVEMFDAALRKSVKIVAEGVPVAEIERLRAIETVALSYRQAREPGHPYDDERNAREALFAALTPLPTQPEPQVNTGDAQRKGEVR